jgi:serine/threonine protein phosphatase PrpC
MTKQTNIMSQFTFEPSHTIATDFAIQQMASGQDYVCTGTGVDSETGESFDYTMLNDGHGGDFCINYIRGMSANEKAECIGSPDPIRALVAKIDGSGCVPIYKSSGATAVILKCYADRAQVITCGDSQAVIFKDGAVMHITQEHNSTHQEERVRVTASGKNYFVQSSNVRLVSDTEMELVQAEYLSFPNGSMLACTQALGHNSITGYAPASFTFVYQQGVSYKVVLASDGVFDMMIPESENDMEMLRKSTSQEICDWTVARWLQEWRYKDHNGNWNRQQYKRENCDDVSVAIARITFKQPVE